ncbi:unnamed protein product, partial [Discosporangium mesarthrocarpum]
DSRWSKLETDHVVSLCLKYDLRWPVIKDRYTLEPERPVQELQQRFYDMANRLQVMRRASDGAGASGGAMIAMPGLEEFNATHEAERRNQLEVQFKKTRQKEEEEGALREELKLIDSQIKKLKQSTRSSNKAGEELQALADARKSVGHAPAPGHPYLLSFRLSEKSQTPTQSIGKGLLKKVKTLMADLAVPEHPMASKEVVDLYDHLKRDMITLFSLDKVAQKKENDLLLARQSPEQQQQAGQGAQALSAAAPGTQSLARAASGRGATAAAPQAAPSRCNTGAQPNRTMPTRLLSSCLDMFALWVGQGGGPGDVRWACLCFLWLLTCGALLVVWQFFLFHAGGWQCVGNIGQIIIGTVQYLGIPHRQTRERIRRAIDCALHSVCPISLMNISYAYLLCISLMHIPHAYLLCISLTHISYAYPSCISLMHIPHAYLLCISLMH